MPDKLLEELETLELEEDTEELGFELNEYFDIPQLSFTFSFGVIYEF